MNTSWSLEQQAIFQAFADHATNPGQAEPGVRGRNGRGNLVVRARAGTGKTTTIVEALSHVPPGVRSLLTAFNKKNAEDLAGRLAFVGARNAEAKTLHALGFALLRAHRRVKVDGREGRAVAKRVCRNAPTAIVSLVAELASKVKSCLVPAAVSLDAIEDVAWRFDCLPSREQEKAGWTIGRVARLVERALDTTKAKEHDAFITIDFDDMVWLPLAWGLESRAYDLVVVDEAQDMSPTQLALALGACREDGRIVVVGDDRQAIYAFRGADSGAIDRMKTLLDARELPLPTTYRCPRLVVDLAREIVPDYCAAPEAPVGRVDRATPEDLVRIAAPGCYVLGRTNAAIVKACLELLRAGVPAEVAGRDIGAQVLALVERLANGSARIVDLLRHLGNWAVEERARARERARVKNIDADAMLDEIDDKSATIEALCDGLTSVAELRARVAVLFGDGTEGARVTCSTVHRAKGMERDLVIVLEDSLRSGKVEEDNIRYVALTRAKRRLVLLSQAYDPGDVDDDDATAWAAAAVLTDLP